jgi:hypothetical protein
MLHIAVFLTRHCLARRRRQQGPRSGHRSPASFADPLVGIALPRLEDTCVASAETGSDSLEPVNPQVRSCPLRARSSGQTRALTVTHETNA